METASQGSDAPRARAVYQELVRATGPRMDPGLREQASIMLLEIEAYAAAHSTPLPPLLQELVRETEAQFGELLAVVGMAAETNRLAEALLVPVDPAFE